MNVVLLHDASALDGRPDERDALREVDFVGRVLRDLGHETAVMGFGLDLASVRTALLDARVDVVVNLVESVGGEGRLIHLAPALLESMGIPFTGAGTEAMLMTSQKVLTKRWLTAAGEPTPAWLDQDGRSGGDVVWPGRFIVKSVWEDASLGLDDDAVVEMRGPEELLDCIQARRGSLGGEAFAEAWVEGREFNLAVLEVDGEMCALPAAEMCFVDYPAHKPRLVGYRAKWDEASFEATHTVRGFEFEEDDQPLLGALNGLATRVCRQFGLQGYARVDVRVDGDGRPWVLELNANPCLSPDAGFLAAAERGGFDAPSVVEAVVRAALRRFPEPAQRS